MIRRASYVIDGARVDPLTNDRGDQASHVAEGPVREGSPPAILGRGNLGVRRRPSVAPPLSFLSDKEDAIEARRIFPWLRSSVHSCIFHLDVVCIVGVEVRVSIELPPLSRYLDEVKWAVRASKDAEIASVRMCHHSSTQMIATE